VLFARTTRAWIVTTNLGRRALKRLNACVILMAVVMMRVPMVVPMVVVVVMAASTVIFDLSGNSWHINCFCGGNSAHDVSDVF
jgi:hypothetical protein